MIRNLVEYFKVDKKALSVKNKLEFLIKTETDLIRLEEIITVNKNIVYTLFDALCDLRYEKIQENNMPYQEFEKLYNTDKVNALEKLFQEKIDGYIIYKLENKIASNRITLEELYSKHQEEPGRTIVRFIK